MNRSQFMARTIAFPVQFEFNNRPMKWFLGVLNPHAWRRHRNRPWMLEALVLSPSRFKGFKYDVAPDKLPDQIRQELPPRGDRLPAHLCRMGIEVFLFVPPDAEPKTSKIDPWLAREEFQLVGRSMPDLLAFLNRYGAWKGSVLDLSTAPWRQPRLAFPADFWNDQSRVRDALKKGEKGWSWKKLNHFRPRPEFPHYVHEDNFCLDAIYTATMVDFMKGVRFRNCARQDCPNVFPADRKGKVYCQQYCGHIVSVRRNRRQAARQEQRLRAS